MTRLCDECRAEPAEIKCTSCRMKVCRNCAEYHGTQHGHEVFKNERERQNLLRRLRS